MTNLKNLPHSPLTVYSRSFPATHLVEATGTSLEREAPARWRWKRRSVKIADGATMTMADTEANRAVYPQPATQKPGLGFPIVRLVVLFSLSVGTVLKYALGPYQGKQTGENQLFRGMLAAIAPEDVVLGDRYYGDYWNFALVRARQLAGNQARLPARSSCPDAGVSPYDKEI